MVCLEEPLSHVCIFSPTGLQIAPLSLHSVADLQTETEVFSEVGEKYQPCTLLKMDLNSEGPRGCLNMSTNLLDYLRFTWAMRRAEV